MKKIIFKKTGFTLAEVLVTLTVIGVVAALTIPVMLSSTNDVQLRSKWKKVYQDISNGMQMFVTKKGANLNGLFASVDDERDQLASFLHYTKTCDAGTAVGTNGCFPADLKYLNRQSTGWDLVTMSRAVLNNGVNIAFGQRTVDCSFTDFSLTNICGEIYVDVNGAATGPNTLGRDIYEMYLFADGSVKPRGSTGDNPITDPAVSCIEGSTVATNYGWGCGRKYLE